MAVDLPQIRQRVVVDDNELGKLESGFGRVAGTLGKAVAAGAAAAATAIAGFTAVGVRGAIDVDRGLREVVTLFGETGDEADKTFERMRSGVADLSNEVGIAQDVITSGLYQAISAGVPDDNVFEFMEVASKAAIGGVTDVETAVDGLTTIINAFGLEADDAQDVADAMFEAVKAGKTNFEELSSSMFQVAPAASAAGVAFDETLAAVAALTSAGVPTAVATTRIRSAIDELAKPTTKVAQLFEELTGKGFRQFTEEGGTLQDALAVLSEHADDTGIAIGDLFGSVEAAGAATSLAGAQADAFADNIAAMADRAGSAETAFEQMEESTSRQMEKLKTTLHNLAIEVGFNLLPHVNRIVEWAQESLPPAIEKAREVIATLIEIFHRVRETVTTVTAWIEERWATISAVLAAAAAIIGAVLVAMIPHFVAVGAAAIASSVRQAAAWAVTQASALKAAVVHSAQVVGMVARWVFLGVQSLIHAAKVAAAWLIAMGPIALVIAAVVALVALIVAKWDEIVAVVRAGWEAVTRWTRETWERLTAWLSSTWEAIKTAVSDTWEAIKTSIRNAWEAVKTATTNAIESVLTWLRELPGRIVGALVGLTTTVLGFIREYHPVLMLLQAASNVWPELSSWLSGMPGRIVDAIGSLATTLLGAGKDLVRGLWEGIRSMGSWLASRVASFVTDRIPGPIAKALGMRSPSKVAMSLGRDTGRGLAIGLEDTAREVARASERLAGAALPPLPSDGGFTDARSWTYQASATGSPVHVDEAELVRQLRRLELLAQPVGGR